MHVVNSFELPLTFLKSYSLFAGVQDALVQWWYAHNAVGEPEPAAAGQKQSWVLTGLPSGKPLYFAMSVHDEAGNRSD